MTSISLLILGSIMALAYLFTGASSAGWRVSLVKTAAVALLALAAVRANAAPFLSAALILCALGDLALSRPGRAAFLYGLSTFALAHLLYILLFSGLSGQAVWNAFAIAPVPALFVIGLAFSSELWLAPYVGDLRWPVRIYVALISAMMLGALTLPAPYGLVTIGATLFVVSDVALALHRFRLSANATVARLVGSGVWLLYFAGQASIFWGAQPV